MSQGSWKVKYYKSLNGRSPVEEFLNSLPKKSKSKIYKVIYYLEKFGLNSVIPHTKKLVGTKFWEIRILGKDNVRVIYVGVKGRRILLLHGFLKKKQKTPKREIRTAIARFESLL